MCTRRSKTCLPSLLFLMTVAMLFSACRPRIAIGPEQTFAIKVPHLETGDASKVTLEMAVPQGRFELIGGADGVIQGVITFNAAEYEPKLINGDGELLISQTEPGPKSVVVSVQNDVINQWDLQLGDTPRNLEIRLGNGEYTVNLAQPLPAGFNATVSAGVGNVDLFIDPALAARVVIGEKTDLLEVATRGDWIQNGNTYETGAGLAVLTIAVNMRGGTLTLDNK